MQTTPVLSVILPYCREGEWLQEALLSIQQQTFSDFELLLTGNNPDPVTREIAASAAAADSRIRLFYSSASHLGEVLNETLVHATGAFIARMDADDVAFPHRFERQMEQLHNNSTIDVSSVQTAPHPDGIPGAGLQAFMDWQNQLVRPEEHYHHRFIEAVVAHPSVLFRASLLKEQGFYPEEGPEDFGLWLRWLSAGVRFEKIPEPLLYWRDHPKRLSRIGQDYSSDAFTRIKAKYAIPYLHQKLNGRKLILCGAGKEVQKKIKFWQESGLHLDGYSDLTPRNLPLPYWEPATITPNQGAYFLSLLNGRGKAAEMRQFFESRGLIAESDFLISS